MTHLRILASRASGIFKHRIAPSVKSGASKAGSKSKYFLQTANKGRRQFQQEAKTYYEGREQRGIDKHDKRVAKLERQIKEANLKEQLRILRKNRGLFG